MDDQHDEHDHDGRDDGLHQRRHGLLGDGHGASRLDGGVLRQVKGRNILVKFLVLSKLTGTRQHIGHHRDATPPIAMGEVVVTKRRSQVRHLTKRHPSAGMRCGHQHISKFLIINIMYAFGVNFGRKVIAILPHGDQVAARKRPGQIDRQLRLGHPKPAGLVDVEIHLHNLLRLVIVGMNEAEVGILFHHSDERVAQRGYLLVGISGDIILDRGVNHLIVHLFEPNLRQREIVLVLARVLLHHLLGGFFRVREHDELCIRIRRHGHGRVGDMETRRRHADEGRHGADARIAPKDIRQRVGHRRRLVQGTSRGKMYLHGKAVALGLGQHLHVDAREQEESQCHKEPRHKNCAPFVAETEVQQLLIAPLKRIEESGLYLLQPRPVAGIGPLDDAGRQERDHPDGIEKTAQKGDENGPREEFHEVAHVGTPQQRQHREKHERHRTGGDEHGGHEAAGGDRRRIPARMACV